MRQRSVYFVGSAFIGPTSLLFSDPSRQPYLLIHQTPCLSNECGRELADNGREPYTINADGQRYRSGCAADGVGDVVLSFRECNLEEETVTYERVNIILFQCIDKC